MNSRAAGKCGAWAIGAALLLAGCGGGGGGGASDDIKASVSKLIEDRDCSAATEQYRKSLTGETDVKKCSHDLSLRNRVKTLTIAKVTSSGDSGTAAVTTDGDKVVLKFVKQGGDWLIDGDGGVDKADSSSSKSTATTTAPADTSRTARVGFTAALGPYRTGRKRFEKRVLEDIKARNLEAVKGDFSQYRDVLFNFDGTLRKIDFPSSASDEVTKLLEADRAEVADLDAVGSAPSFSEIQRLLTSRLKEDDTALGRALGELTIAL